MLGKRFLSIDPFLLLLVLTLGGLGLTMLYSASSIPAEIRFSGDSLYFFIPQLRNMLLGILMMLILSQIPYQFWTGKMVYPILAGTVLLLVLVLVMGSSSGTSAQRWLNIGGFSFQPSELAKLTIAIYFAYSLTRKGEENRTLLRGFLPHLLVCGTLAGLIYMEPDLGTAACVGCIAVIMMFVAGIRFSHMVVAVIGLVSLVTCAIAFTPFRVQRILVYLDPWSDPQGTGYHIIHSFYAFASGGLWGQGPGGSLQKLFFLPEAHTDFIFSVAAEELGFAGVFVISVLFLLLIARGFAIARSAIDLRGLYLAVGCTLVVGLPAFLNLGVVTGLFPTKGLPLPFFSYGGTNLLVSFAAMGILLNVSAQSTLERPKPPKKFRAARIAAQ